MSGFLDGPAPRWLTIAPHRPFLTDLAHGLTEALAADGPYGLSEATVLLPTRRACRALAEAFLQGGERGAVLLPQIRALGDLDENEAPFEPGDLALDLPPAIGEHRRRFELAGIAVSRQDLLGRALDATAALDMAQALAAFLDACHLEETGGVDDLDGLVEGELAQHWQVSARFLKAALSDWAGRLEALGLVDPARRRVMLMRRLAERWRDRPPSEPLVAAGSTGSAPAAADLLAAIAAAPRGAAVLPGLDTALPEKAWMAVDDAHPQAAMKRLLARAGVDRGAVRPFDQLAERDAGGRWRRRLINIALAPPAATADWLGEIASLRAEGKPDRSDPVAAGLAGLSVVSAATEDEAAAMAALLLREILETPGATAALVTPDAVLARRVSARLERWGIDADSSAGVPLAGQPAAVLAQLVARACVDPADPIALLALLKHPLSRLGLEASDRRRGCDSIEQDALRGPRRRDWAAIRARLGGKPGEVLADRLHEAVAQAAAPWNEAAAPVADAARALARAIEAIAADPDGRGPWAGPAGEATAEVLAALINESAALPPVTRGGFRDLLEGLLSQTMVRGAAPGHPRLQILGVLEARLIGADRLILAGLEEGVWPKAVTADPFLSRPMRARVGLPAPERRIGLSAHDLAQGACAPQVVLLSTARREGAPAVESRWLWRLRTLARGAGVDLPGRPDLVAIARSLDAPLADPRADLRPAARPAPRPPVAARPRALSVTDVERWVRDPYGLYARRILRLQPLDPPDAPVEARLRGTAIHAAIEAFTRAHPEDLPEAAEDILFEFLLEAVADAGMANHAMVRERALAGSLAPWLLALERRRRPGARLLVEQRGEIIFESALGPFTLSARADRIEWRSGCADILDFKTGQPPSNKEVAAGFAPQLTLTGAILAGGGFKDIGPIAPGELVYVRVTGRRTPGEAIVRATREEAEAQCEKTLANLKRRIAAFADAARAYHSWEFPKFRFRRGGDYDHLARVWEWMVAGEDDGGVDA